MRTIYIDGDFRCHVVNGEGFSPVETDFFDGKADQYIEGYHFIPEGECWTREDGTVFFGEMIAPATSLEALLDAQRADESAALAIVGAVGEGAPSDMAMAVRHSADRVMERVSDDDAYDFYYLHPFWESGRAYAAGERCRRPAAECVFKCLQAHTSDSLYPPETVPALWRRLNESHSGTVEDPIPADMYMEYKAGLYYTEGGTLYRCTRGYDGGTGHLPHQLIGLYFEAVL